jgi:hypothetical protein
VFGLAAFLLGPARDAGAQLVYTPRGAGLDDGPALQALLDQGHRHIQLDGDAVINTPVLLHSPALQPYHFVRIEPVPSRETVRITTAIGRDPVTPSNPAFAAFEYSGHFTPASRLLEATAVGATSIRVVDPSPYGAGGHVYLADALTAPEHTEDGACEVRRVVSVVGDTLTLDRALKREHAANVAVALTVPLFGPVFRRLTFSGDAHVALHLGATQEARIEAIASHNWRGGVLVLLDTGGYRNVVTGSFATGTQPGLLVPGANTWGIAVEGQDETTIFNSGATKAYVGVLINYSIDTWAYWTTVSDSDVNVVVGSDNTGNGSLRSGFRFGLSARGRYAGASIGRNCRDCEVSLDLVDNGGYEVSVGSGAERARVGFGNRVGRTRSLCGVILYPGTDSGAGTAATVDLQFPDCSSRTNICRNAPGFAGRPLVTLGPYATSCAAGATTGGARSASDERGGQAAPPSSAHWFQLVQEPAQLVAAPLHREEGADAVDAAPGHLQAGRAVLEEEVEPALDPARGEALHVGPAVPHHLGDRPHARDQDGRAAGHGFGDGQAEALVFGDLAVEGATSHPPDLLLPAQLAREEDGVVAEP